MKERDSTQRLRANFFRHIYVERSVIEESLTREILSRLKDSFVILVDDYLEIFGRKKQDFYFQKLAPSIILAKKKKNFVYPLPSYCQNYGFEESYYSTLVLNCIFDCEYCFLQGMYSSAHIVIFVNLYDFFNEIEEKFGDRKIFLSISYNTDLLALEGLTSFVHKLYGFIKDHKKTIVELRTKSSNFGIISDLLPLENLILAWTLMPEELIKRFESRTPPLSSRVWAIKRAIDKGWKVRFCFDPVLIVDNADIFYKDMLDYLISFINPKEVFDVTVGNFRMNKEYLKRVVSRNVSLANEDERIFNFIVEEIRRVFVEKTIFCIYNKTEAFLSKPEI